MEFIKERASVEIFGDNPPEVKPNWNYLPEYDGGTDFVNEGRAVINFAEFQDFKQHLENAHNEELYLINVDWDYMQDRVTRDLCLKGLNTLQGQPKVGLKYSKHLISNIAECHLMSTQMFENGVLIATNDESHDFKTIINNMSRLEGLKHLANDVVDDAKKACMQPCPATHVMIFVDRHIIQRYFKQKITIRQAPRTKQQKRVGLDDTFIAEMKTDPKRTAQNFEIQLDEKMGTMKRKTAELQELMEDMAASGNNVNAQYLQTLDDKTQEIQNLCDRIDALIVQVQREASSRIEMLSRKIDVIERTKEQIEETVYHNEDEYAGKTTNMQGRISELILQLANARADGQTKQEVVIELEQELQQKETTLASWQTEVEAFTNQKLFETQKLESLLAEKEDDLVKSREEIAVLKRKEKAVSAKRQETKQLTKDAGVSPFKIQQMSATKCLPTKKSPIPHRHRSTSHPLNPVKLEFIQSSSSEDEFESAEEVPKPTRAHIFMAGENNDATETKIKHTFTATPSKFGMKSWDPKDCGFMEHLIRLEMGLKQSENKGCDLDTRENLILMTLPADYSYVNEYVKGSRTSMQDFKRKLVELIIGTNIDQTTHLMQCQRKVGEHVLSYLNRLQNIYSYCSNKSESEMENDAWGVRIIFQKIIGAMSEAGKLELQRQVEDQAEQGNLTFSALKSAVVKAARKSGKSMTDYVSVNQIDQSHDFFAPQPMAPRMAPQPMPPQPVPPHMMNRVSLNEYSNRDDRNVYQARSNGRENDSVSSGMKHGNDDWKRNCRCYYCDIMGHVKADCRRRKADESRQSNNNTWKKNYDGAKKDNRTREHKDKPQGSSDKRNNSRWKGKPKN